MDKQRWPYGCRTIGNDSPHLTSGWLVAAMLAMFALVDTPFVAKAQQTTPLKRVGVVHTSGAAAVAKFNGGFREGMLELGWAEGKNVQYEFRYADGKPDRLPEIMAELVRMPVDVLVTSAAPPTLAATNATSTIPIVATIQDPIGRGLISSPGNVAAYDYLPSEIAKRQVGLLQETIPGLSRVALVYNPFPGALPNVQLLRKDAQAAGLQVDSLEVSDFDRLEGAFAAARSGGSQAVMVLGSPMFYTQRSQVARLAQASGLIVLYQDVDYVDAGGLLAYGPSNTETFKASAHHVDRILKGTRPGDLPVGAPPRLILAVNLATARAMGIALPASVLSRADKKVE